MLRRQQGSITPCQCSRVCAAVCHCRAWKRMSRTLQFQTDSHAGQRRMNDASGLAARLHFANGTRKNAYTLKNVDAIERARPKIFRRLAWIRQSCVCERSTFKHSLLHLKAMFCATKDGLLRSEKPPFGHRAAPPRLSWSDCMFIKKRLYDNRATVERFFNILLFTNTESFC